MGNIEVFIDFRFNDYFFTNFILNSIKKRNLIHISL